MRGMRSLSALLIFSAFFIISCSPRRGVPYTEPLTEVSEEVHQGKVLFHNFCNTCHPNGAAGLGPAINNKPLPGFLIRFQIRNGIGTMPSFSKEVISDEDSKKIVAYLKELRKLDDR